jgi:hypothetical protein
VVSTLMEISVSTSRASSAWRRLSSKDTGAHEVVRERPSDGRSDCTRSFSGASRSSRAISDSAARREREVGERARQLESTVALA